MNSKEIGSIFEVKDLVLTFNSDRTKTIKTPIITVEIDESYLQSSTIKFLFSSKLFLSTNVDTEINFLLTLFQSKNESETKAIATTKYNKNILATNSPEKAKDIFEFSLSTSELEAGTEFFLEVTSISVTASSELNIGLSGTIIACTFSS